MSKREGNKILNEKIEELFTKEDVDKEQTILLRKMIERQDRDIMLSRVIAFAECGLLAVLIIVFAYLVPKFLNTVTRVHQTMDSVDQMLEHAETSMSEITDLAVDIDSMVETNEEAISEAIGHFNDVDFDSLNRSISHLAQIMEPVVEVVQILKE